MVVTRNRVDYPVVYEVNGTPHPDRRTPPTAEASAVCLCGAAVDLSGDGHKVADFVSGLELGDLRAVSL